MPSGMEIWYAVTGDDARVAANHLYGQSFKDEAEFLESVSDLDDDPLLNQFNDKLDACYPEALRAIGLTPIGTSGNYITVDTPLGKRSMAGWNIAIQYDPAEMGDEHAVLGIALSGRYYPTLLDWRDKNGTLMNPVDLRDLLKDANKVLPIINRELPFTKDWKLMLVEIFY